MWWICLDMRTVRCEWVGGKGRWRWRERRRGSEGEGERRVNYFLFCRPTLWSSYVSTGQLRSFNITSLNLSSQPPSKSAS